MSHTNTKEKIIKQLCSDDKLRGNFGMMFRRINGENVNTVIQTVTDVVKQAEILAYMYAEFLKRDENKYRDPSSTIEVNGEIIDDMSISLPSLKTQFTTRGINHSLCHLKDGNVRVKQKCLRLPRLYKFSEKTDITLVPLIYHILFDHGVIFLYLRSDPDGKKLKQADKQKLESTLRRKVNHVYKESIKSITSGSKATLDVLEDHLVKYETEMNKLEKVIRRCSLAIFMRNIDTHFCGNIGNLDAGHRDHLWVIERTKTICTDKKNEMENKYNQTRVLKSLLEGAVPLVLQIMKIVDKVPILKTGFTNKSQLIKDL